MKRLLWELSREETQMGIKRFFFVLIISLSVNLMGQSLSETVDIVLKNNASIQAKMQAVIAAQKQAEATRANTLPTINFDGTYNHITHVAVMDVAAQLPPSLQGGFPPIQLGNYDTYDLGISANYLLFTGFAHKNSIAIKNEQQKLSENQLIKTQKEAAFQAVAAYRRVQSRYFEISSLDSAKRRTELQLQRIKIIVGQGMALALDTLELTLAKLSYTQKIIAAKSALESDREFLNNLAGQRIEVEPLLEFLFTSDEETYYGEKDERLKSLKIQESILTLNKALSKSGYYPVVALNAAYKYGNPGADIIQREWMDYAVWGVGVHWNLFRWGADKKTAEASEAQIKSLQHQYQVLNDNIKTEFDKSKRELKSLKEQLKVLAAALRVAKEKLRLINNRYQQGMATTTDFNDANLNMAETELNYKRFVVAVALKSNELDYKSGKPIQQWRLEQ